MSRSARERAIQALRVHAPELAGGPLVELGQGLDNVAFLAGELVLRIGDAGRVVREARLLDIVASRVPLPVPSPCFIDEEVGVLAYTLLPGRPLLGRRPPDGSAHRLGRFLRELHAIEPAPVGDLVPVEDADPVEWLADLDGPPHMISLLRRSVPSRARRRVLIHADLGAEHILERDGQLTGVIDWSDAAIADAALDFARLYRDFGAAFLGETLGAYGGMADADVAMARIEFFARCAALEDLAFGRASGRADYAEAAERSLRRLFPPTR